METVANIFLKSDKSFEINEISQVPLMFNYNEYNYYLSLLSFSFLNCSPNIYEDQHFRFSYTQTVDGVTSTIDEDKTVEAGLYDTEDLINLINSYFNITLSEQGQDPVTEQILTTAINPFNELVEIQLNMTAANKVHVSHVVIHVSDYKNNKDLFANDLFRFPAGDISLYQGSPSYRSSRAFRISTYNNVMLTSSSIPGLTSLYGNESDADTGSGIKGITTSSAMYVISSVASAYTTISYTAIQPVDFRLDGIPNLTNFQFKLVDENNNDLKLLPNSTPDFSVKLAIKRVAKHRY